MTITEHEFFVRIVNEKRGHSITTVRGSNKLITLRLLSDVELGWTPIPKSRDFQDQGILLSCCGAFPHRLATGYRRAHIERMKNDP